ncbi:hypothetical protein [Saccharothrix sp. S26]|uniref:hypothetical protein n=1 Tax=Saccharothrix sp. S26 TaxID=2907215 RepID=UPI001F46E227|nr:hypothetical protein [Saccharothrix sp. S26]
MIGQVLQGDDVAPEEIFEALNEQDSLIVGSPETCRKKLRVHADLGIDRLMAFHQVGSLKHEDVVRSLRLIGDLIPEFDGWACGVRCEDGAHAEEAAPDR